MASESPPSGDLVELEHDGLAVFHTATRGDLSVPPILFMPYPHALETSTSLRVRDILRHLLKPEHGERLAFTFDPPGAGLSKRPMRLSMEEMVECADEAFGVVCRALDADWPDTDVFGHSMSALAALAFSIEGRTRVRRMVLVGPAGPAGRTYMNANGALWNSSHPDFFGLAWRGMVAKYIWPSKATTDHLMGYIAERSFFDLAKAPPRTPWSWADLLVRHPNPRATSWSSVAINLDYSDRLASCRAREVLCLNGAHDPQTPVECAEAIVDGLGSRAKLVVFKNSGHSPFLEEPATFWEAVDGFLNSGSAEGIPRPK